MLIVHRVLWKGKPMKSGKGVTFIIRTQFGNQTDSPTIWIPNMFGIWAPTVFETKAWNMNVLLDILIENTQKCLNQNSVLFFKLFYKLCTGQQKDLTVTIWILDLNAIQMVQRCPVWKWSGIQMSSEYRPNSPVFNWLGCVITILMLQYCHNYLVPFEKWTSGIQMVTVFVSEIWTFGDWLYFELKRKSFEMVD